jgi:peptidyl-tRNA hydrolase, PTH1 family
VARGQCDDATVHLILPTTYMNNSGIAVRRYLDYFKLMPQQLVVVVDDVALPFGEMRLRGEGSSGGHNGLKSLTEHLATSHYARLRMGIGSNMGHPQSHPEGQPEGYMPLADYVLSDFSTSEVGQLEEFIDRGTQVLMRLIKEPIAIVMNAINTRQETQKVKRIEENPRDVGQENKA